MRRTTCGQWVHATCALWTPGTWINCDTGLVEGLSKLAKVHFPNNFMPAQAYRIVEAQARTGCDMVRSTVWSSCCVLTRGLLSALKDCV